MSVPQGVWWHGQMKYWGRETASHPSASSRKGLFPPLGLPGPETGDWGPGPTPRGGCGSPAGARLATSGQLRRRTGAQASSSEQVGPRARSCPGSGGDPESAPSSSPPRSSHRAQRLPLAHSQLCGGVLGQRDQGRPFHLALHCAFRSSAEEGASLSAASMRRRCPSQRAA